MGVTILESAKYSGDVRKMAVAKTIVEKSPVLDRIRFKTIQGNAYRYDEESSLPTVAFRGVGGTYTHNEGILIPKSEVISILGGEVEIDNFQIKTQGDVHDLKRTHFEWKARALAQQFDTTFFEGDSNTNVNSFDGLRKRITGNQLIWAGTNGAALTLDMLDQLLDQIPYDDKVLFMNRTLRRKINALVRAQTGTMRIEVKQDQFGKQYQEYAGVPIYIMEHQNDASTILDFDETRGSSDVTASIYCVSFGDDEKVHGLLGAGGSWEVKDFGELESKPAHMGRIEIYLGMCVQDSRSAARLGGVLNS